MLSEKQADRRWRIRTCGRDTQAEDAHHSPYEPTPYAVLDRIAESGFIGRDNLLVDYGCGRGRVSLMLSHLTGCRSLGIDFNPFLLAAAEDNRASFTGSADALFLLRDAERFDPPADADRFYFFNPFSPEILRSVLNRIAGSWYAAPRPMRLLFYYPSDEYVRLLMQGEMFSPDGEIGCGDLFPGNERERVLVFRVDG
ncbi:MAG: class I SAM-dependent methyltransferase [Clostridia bacterium]|nr:class I SAM-dependent methyltransferase [Clostridia bacterium]